VQNEIAANRIKNSPEIFTSLLFRQRQVDTTPFENDFLIGDPAAPINLTMAVNLYCGPCKNELEKAKELLSIYPGKVNLRLRFLKSGDGGQTSGLLLKTWLDSLKQRNNGLSDGQVLIDEWYETMNAKKFATSYPAYGAVSDTETEEYSQAHYAWLKGAGITKTPTTFMNGYELPSSYRMKDLFLLIPGITDFFIDPKDRIKTEASSEGVKI